VSRTRRAAAAAAFGYAQFGLALASGILLIPLILEKVGTRSYGVWLGVGELVAYATLVDLGVVNVIPWLLAERDGRGDRDAMRDLIGTGLALAMAAALVFATLATVLLLLGPRVTGLDPLTRAALAGPVALTVAGAALAYPLRVFQAVVTGLQDVRFAGTLGLAQQALSVLIVVALLLTGHGLYALAVGAVAPPLVVGIASLIRVRSLAPDLLRGWRRPIGSEVRHLAAQGFGAWTAAFGWRMVAASSSLVLLSVAGPEAVVVLACTAKLGEVAMQMSWQLPDAALVGLAQLSGEGVRDRVAEVSAQLIRLTLVGAAAVACMVLAFNAVFVSVWVGPTRFGGWGLNLALAGVVIGHSLTHALFAVGSTLGGRVQAGFAAVLQGAVQIGCALILGRLWGALGIALAVLVGVVLVAAPIGVRLVARHAGLSARELWRRVFAGWVARCVPLAALGALVGPALVRGGLVAAAIAAPLLGLLFLRVVAPLLRALPLPPRMRASLAWLGMAPTAEPAS
jgi:O-antigen/teichoic acid export membrane protein